MNKIKKNNKSYMSKYGEITEATAEKIQKADKAMSGCAAVSKYFADVIKDVGVNQDNINLLWTRATDIIQHIREGFLSAADGTKALDESFRLLLEGAQNLGQEGSTAMVNFILKVRESGIEVRSVTEYVISELGKIPAALTTLINSTMATSSSIQELGQIALLSFNSMLASGMRWTDAVAAMSGPLVALRDKYAELGITGEMSKLSKEKRKKLGGENGTLSILWRD